MQSKVGRVARSGLGLIMIAAGIGMGGAWWALAVAGLLPLAAGALGFCLAAPLFGAPLHQAQRRI